MNDVTPPVNDFDNPRFTPGHVFEAPHIVYGDNRRLYGGSFFKAPYDTPLLLINLMAEYEREADIYVPIKDYSVPDGTDGMIKAFEAVMADSENAYVGCFGGMGRTGLFMSCFLRYQGMDPDEALALVRSQYNPHAVETETQKQFLRDFPVAQPPQPSSSMRM